MSDSQPLAGKTALVTGASSGLGKHFAELLARNGARVAISARRRDRLDEVAEAINRKGGRAFAARHDVTDLTGIGPLLDKIEAALGPVDILINNAGLNIQKPLLDCDETDYDTILDTNLKAAFFMAQGVAARLIRRKAPGRIVNIASLVAERAIRQLGLYGASKAGLVQLTRVMALEWARHDINVNAVLPGYLVTEMNAEYFDSERGRKFVESFPRRRVGKPEDLDEVILVLVSGGSRFLTGAALTVDDGQGFTIY